MAKMERREDVEAKRLMVKTQQHHQPKLTEWVKSSRCCNDIWRSSGPPAEESEGAVWVVECCLC